MSSSARKNALITGISGYVGSHLAVFLRQAGWNVCGVDRVLPKNEELKDIPFLQWESDRPEKLYEFIEQAVPLCVFHLAAAFQFKDDPGAMYGLLESNLVFSGLVLDAAKKAGCKNFVNTGSHWQHYQDAEYEPVDVYAATKQSFQILLESYCRLYGMRAISLHLFDPYGEDDTRNKLLPCLIRNIRTQTAMDLTRGEQVIDFVHISDVCSAFQNAAVRCMQTPETGHEVFGVSSGHRYVLRRLLEDTAAEAGIRLPVVFGVKPYRFREIMQPWSQFQILPNWTPKHDIRTDLLNIFSEMKK